MLYLASKSPRRQELLVQIAQRFELVPASIDEIAEPGESAMHFVERMAIEKAQAGLNNLAKINPGDMVLGSDTVVVNAGNILGKPESFEHCLQMLTSLSNKQHQVLTAVAIIKAEQAKLIKHTDAAVSEQQAVLSTVVSTEVNFKELSPEEIKQYWQTGEPQDKAGGYGIQGIAGKFVKSINGSYSAVVGLPLYETEQLLLRAKNINKKGVL
ncbi:septum formation protein Maf [Thalassotalea sp. 42_200_T64]|nr:septum formation protein Maf [Thalassotalea sp. 42_200_T64]